MNDNELDILEVSDFDAFASGESTGNFLLDEGAYDGARVVGWTIVKREFENKERKLVQLLWQIKNDDKTYNLRGSGWSISSNEKSTLRIELSKWFNKTTWGDVVDVLVKGGILTKTEDGKGKFCFDAFIGKYGKLLVAEKTSKKGSKYNVISSISPAKKKEEFEWGEVPEYMVKSEDVLAYKLADGVQIHVKKAEDEIDIPKESDEKKKPSEPKKVSAKEFINQTPEGTEEDDTDLPF